MPGWSKAATAPIFIKSVIATPWKPPVSRGTSYASGRGVGGDSDHAPIADVRLKVTGGTHSGPTPARTRAVPNSPI